MSHNTITITRNYKYDPNESKTTIHFSYFGGNLGSYMEPAESSEVNILKIEANGSDITDLITEEEFEEIEIYIYEDWEDESFEEESDYKYEQSCDED